MSENTGKNFRNELWVERYRPRTIDACILPDSLKTHFKKVVESREVQNYLFVGPSGTGKTTLAYALASELNAEIMFINGSMEGNIDNLRNGIKDFCSTVSMTDQMKIVFFDEADHLTYAAQTSLRAFIETFSSNVRFIFTANYLSKIIDPLHSRLAIVNFNFSAEEQRTIKKGLHVRVLEILSDHEISFDRDALQAFLRKFYPDIRRIINNLQVHAQKSKHVSYDILSQDDYDLNRMFGLMKAEDWDGLKEWTVEHSLSDFTALYTSLFNEIPNYVVPSCLPEVWLSIAEWQKTHSVVADKVIHVLGMLVDVYSNAEWK